MQLADSSLRVKVDILLSSLSYSYIFCQQTINLWFDEAARLPPIPVIVLRLLFTDLKNYFWNLLNDPAATNSAFDFQQIIMWDSAFPIIQEVQSQLYIN